MTYPDPDPETIDRAARAAYEVSAGPASGVPWDRLHEDFRDIQRREIHAALAALNEKETADA